MLRLNRLVQVSSELGFLPLPSQCVCVRFDDFHNSSLDGNSAVLIGGLENCSAAFETRTWDFWRLKFSVFKNVLSGSKASTFECSVCMLRFN